MGFVARGFFEGTFLSALALGFGGVGAGATAEPPAAGATASATAGATVGATAGATVGAGIFFFAVLAMAGNAALPVWH